MQSTLKTTEWISRKKKKELFPSPCLVDFSDSEGVDDHGSLFPSKSQLRKMHEENLDQTKLLKNPSSRGKKI